MTQYLFFTVRLEIFSLRLNIILVGVVEESGGGGRREVVGILEREVVVLEEILLGMNSRSFELLFILRWGNHATFRIK